MTKREYKKAIIDTIIECGLMALIFMVGVALCVIGLFTEVPTTFIAMSLPLFGMSICMIHSSIEDLIEHVDKIELE